MHRDSLECEGINYSRQCDISELGIFHIYAIRCFFMTTYYWSDVILFASPREDHIRSGSCEILIISCQM